MTLQYKTSFTVLGAPRTKKNSLRVAGKRILPSKAWETWAKDAVFQTEKGITLRPPRFEWPAGSIRALFYLDAERKVDAVNLYQGLADLLEKRGCVDDDTVFRDWDGSRVLLDRANPRVEVTITCLGR